VAVRALMSDDDLDRLSGFLPEDAGDMLFALAAGLSLTEAVEELHRMPARGAAVAVDVEDFSTALAHPESQRSFKVVESEHDLDAMLDAPLEQWRIFLHPTQRKIVTMQANGPVRVLGGPGTGKTVALMHRAHYLATNIFTGPDDRLLVTTFTRNLANELDGHLQRLCGDAHRRLEVVNLHAWAIRFMRAQGINLTIVKYEDRRRLMASALAEAGSGEHSASFCQEEWERVVQAGDATSRDEYLTASRQGRGARLSRPQRVRLWKVFERYRELLDEQREVEWSDVIRETRLFIEKNKVSLPYRAVLADEVQDFTAGDLRLLRALVPPGPHDLFLVGDAHQRIYGHQTRLGRCGIEIRGRSRRLRVNYRTTAEISRHSLSLLEGRPIDDLDGGKDDLNGYHSLRQGQCH
jgi:superfamily I DNA/RNA helicase